MNNFFKHNLAHKLKQEDGITFLELILVCVFSLFVITLIYQLVFLAQRGDGTLRKNASITGDTGIILDIFDRYFSQNTEFYSVGPYEVTLKVPSKTGGVDYPVVFSAREDGTIVMARTLNGMSEEFILTKNNANYEKNIGLITGYYNVSGEALDMTTGIDYSQVRAVKLTVVAKNPGAKNASDKYVQSSRIVYFRNR